MKEVAKQKIVTEVVGYEAFDGTFFDSKSKCEAYEMEIAEKKLMELVVGETDLYTMFDCGCEDDTVYIVEIKDEADMEIAKLFNSLFASPKCPIFKDSDLGKEVLIVTFDKYEYYRKGTIDEIIGWIVKEYNGAKERYEKEKRK